MLLVVFGDDDRVGNPPGSHQRRNGNSQDPEKEDATPSTEIAHDHSRDSLLRDLHT